MSDSGSMAFRDDGKDRFGDRPCSAPDPTTTFRGVPSEPGMIVVTTPTGNTGHYVVRHLLDAGEMLRLIVRDPGRLPQAHAAPEGGGMDNMTSCATAIIGPTSFR